MSDNSCLKYIDAILYINLEHRKDRNDHIINEIKKIDPKLTKTHRIDAVYNKNAGAIGCSESHIKALSLFYNNPDWNTCIIFEDDFTFNNNTTYINNSILYMFENIPNFDIILLGLGNHDLKLISTPDNNIKKVISSQTASGYIINKKYCSKLLKNFKEGFSNLRTLGFKGEWCVDQYWKRLMPEGNWYTFKERLGYQYGNYSDIENSNVNYNC